MADLKTRLLPLFRRSSASSAKSSASSTTSATEGPRSRSKTSLLLATRGRRGSLAEPVHEEEETEAIPSPSTPGRKTVPKGKSQPTGTQQKPTSLDVVKTVQEQKHTPAVTLEEATPEPPRPLEIAKSETSSIEARAEEEGVKERVQTPQGSVFRSQPAAHINHKRPRPVKTLLEADSPRPRSEVGDYFGEPTLFSGSMLRRKIWVRRPGSSATLVMINEDDLVDDVRDMILKKYANSLGRSFDAPDVTLRIIPRDQSHRQSQGERTLGPEEPMARTLDAYYPGGQTVEEALIIDVPQRRTPRHSPRVHMPYYLAEDIRPGEHGAEYFPPMPPGAASPLHPSTHSNAGSASGNNQSMSVLTTGQIPPLPSPGGRGSRLTQNRPKYGRNNTQSPTAASSASLHENRAPFASAGPVPQPLPTPPIAASTQRSATPPPRRSSPRPNAAKRNSKKNKQLHPAAPQGLLEGAVPPINVLVVEDNSINLKILERFMRLLGVRWQTAMNGREAVNKWRAGGFHLVLMDIQLPVMNGLEATKEIRRLERLNGVGVLATCRSGRSSAAGKRSADGEAVDAPSENGGEATGEDRLMNTELFRSPVIIVALTASSLQSDRHEALAAGCNDFLTKPVNQDWLKRKVMEWGCMQALIDFDGWRKWKDFSQTPPNAKTATAIPPQMLNNSSGSTVASLQSLDSAIDSPKKESPRGPPPRRREVIERTESSSSGSGERGTELVAVRTGKKVKRSSLSGAGALSGVVEDSGENSGVEKGSANGV
ncbi:ssk1 response regulator receiver [Trapelia coarctata]|nr:ssk1 response regulator receiver [Trapelia coarctata]